MKKYIRKGTDMTSIKIVTEAKN